MNKTLVIYYSKSGNTRRVANAIKNLTDADIYEIKRNRTHTSDIGDMIRLYVDSLLPLPKMSVNHEVDIDAYDQHTLVPLCGD